MAITATQPSANALKTTNAFWWANLSSTDDGAAAEFYSRVFGWSWDEMPIGEGMVHRNAQLGDCQIAGLDPMMPGSDFPTAWTNYVFVDDINATCDKAKALGATIMLEPMDVMGEGHMAVFADPTGAACGLWQPGRHTGADAVNQPNTMTWVELMTTDLAGARTFYSEIFGWEWESMDGGPNEYWLASVNGGAPFAGAMTKLEAAAEMPSNWATYFGSADIDATIAEVKAAGGTVLFGPQAMGPGDGAGFLDPQGGYFVAIQLHEWSAS